MNGVLVVDKPTGMTSAAVVARVKRAMQVKKAGHTGTLDPMATGVLPICVGEGTKIAGYLLAEEKAYQGEFVLGFETDTLDVQGKTVEESRDAVSSVTETDIRAAMHEMLGESLQAPPMYSAAHHQGRRLHELARAGRTVERKAKAIVVHEFALLAYHAPSVLFSVRCSKGTYVRVLGQELGRRLRTGATLAALRRTQSGRYQLPDAQKLESLGPLSALEDPAEALRHLPRVTVASALEFAVTNGNPLKWQELSSAPSPAGDIRLLAGNGALLALARVEAERLRYKRVFTYGLTLGAES